MAPKIIIVIIINPHIGGRFYGGLLLEEGLGINFYY